jgi:hypothetical protein
MCFMGETSPVGGAAEMVRHIDDWTTTNLDLSQQAPELLV